MCLTVVDKGIKPYTQGYKIFEITAHPKKLRSVYFYDTYEIGEWYYDVKSGFIQAYDGTFYKKGYHFFTSLAGARKYYLYISVHRIYEVEVKNMVASGRQTLKNWREHSLTGRSYPVGVARAMRIIRERR